MSLSYLKEQHLSNISKILRFKLNTQPIFTVGKKISSNRVTIIKNEV